jgi:adenylate cyclase
MIPSERSIRITTGLILFAFAASHFLSHATGLFLLDEMDRVGRGVLLAPWHTWGGMAILSGAICTHAALGLRAVWRRRHLRIPAREAWQLGLGLSIPLLLIPHAINVRAGHAFYGLDDSYYRILYQYWITKWATGLPRQFFLLLAVWVHGCLGLHMWLRFRPWYRQYSGLLLSVAILIPSLAMLGITNAGWNATMRAALEPGFAAAHGPPPPGSPEAEASANLAALGWRLQIAYVLLIALFFGLRFRRDRIERNRSTISLSYPAKRTITVPQGFSILEASRWAKIPHASICGGRARCSTCRVHVLKGREYLPPPKTIEIQTLSRINAGESLRLACQTRPLGPVSIVPLVPTEAPARPSFNLSIGEGREILTTAFFVDLRGSTQISAGRLPYDALFIIDRYIQAVTGVIRGHGGYVITVAGDGIMALFGVDGDARSGARSALLSVSALVDAIASLSAELADQFGTPLKIGIGLHSGLSVVGQIELSGAFSLQFIGEIGNVAARLEAMTKKSACTAIASDAVFDAAGIEGAIFGERRKLKLRGQDGTIPVILISNVDRLRVLLRAASL